MKIKLSKKCKISVLLLFIFFTNYILHNLQHKHPLLIFKLQLCCVFILFLECPLLLLKFRRFIGNFVNLNCACCSVIVHFVSVNMFVRIYSKNGFHKYCTYTTTDVYDVTEYSCYFTIYHNN